MIDYTLPLDQLPDPLPIEPLRKPFDVTITPPGSKSITCRAYVLAALAEGESKIIRPLRADDTDHLLNALCTLGAAARWEGEDVFIKGVAGRFPRGGNLYMGDGGAPTRFMIACACLAKEPVVIDASPRMRERPIAEGVDMLRQLGAKIEYVEEEGRLPVRVVPSESFVGGELKIGETLSSQFISALLLVSSSIRGGLNLRFDLNQTSVADMASAAYWHLTCEVIENWGLEIHHAANKRSCNCQVNVQFAPINCCEYRIEPDASSAAYWFLAASLFDRARVVIRGLWWNTSQPDIEVAATLDRTYEIDGAPELDADYELVGGPQLKRISKDCSGFPDGSIALAIASARALKASCLTGLRTLRVKETDRIAALANELRKVGCTVETGEDWISIEPPKEAIRAATVRERDDAPSRVNARRSAKDANALPHGRGSESSIASEKSIGSENPVIIETYNDHRMAMAFAILGLVRPGISIRNPACVKKSYPGFWKDFAKLYAD